MSEALPLALATVRDEKGQSPSEASDSLVSLLLPLETLFHCFFCPSVGFVHFVLSAAVCLGTMAYKFSAGGFVNLPHNLQLALRWQASPVSSGLWTFIPVDS